MRWEFAFVVFLALAGPGCCQRLLGRYKVDQSKISVSGFSSGAAMATQMHVSYSSVFMGVGVLAGVPYYYAEGNYSVAVDRFTKPENVNIATLVDHTKKYAESGMIDPTDNMSNDRVFVYHGLNDSLVLLGHGRKVQQYYEQFVNSSTIMSVFDVALDHIFPTMHHGNWCSIAEFVANNVTAWIGRCQYDLAYETLEHIYGNLKRPTADTAVPGDLYEFDQSEFFYLSTPAVSSMDDIGYIYVPSGCKSGTDTCRLHVALHGCLQGRWNVGETFVRNTGYNEVGELNNIIIIYPQVTNITVNPMGCWDYWGYTVSFCTTKNADQALALWRMVQKIAFSTAKTEEFKVDQSKISVSGSSSGAVMAIQMHVAYSSVIMGVGVIAGMPYYCAMGNITAFWTSCLKQYQNINMTILTDQTKTYASNGLIDSTNNMLNDRLYLWHGMNDTSILPEVGRKAERYYEVFVDHSNIMAVFNISAPHVFPTMHYGNSCESRYPWIGRCEYDGAYELLEHIYGNLERPDETIAVHDNLHEFDQGEFLYKTTPAMISMDDVGYMYVPTGCKSGNNPCRLHVAFHGCGQGRYNLEEKFARTTGYNDVGELNNIIIIYPQAINSTGNPSGCWDNWGYNDNANFYATKNGIQALAVWRIIEKFAFTTDGVDTFCETKMLTYISVLFSATVVWLFRGRTA